MQVAPVIFLFSPHRSSAAGAEPQSVAAQLSSLGFSAWLCATLTELYSAAGRKMSASPPPSTVILAGSHSDNCSAAQYLRTLYPGLGIMVQTPSMAEPYVIEAMRSGADVCYPCTASGQLLAAILFRLLQRLSVSGGESVVPPNSEGAWAFHQQGWVLVSPQGMLVRLTTGERAFLGALINSPELRASHAQLFAAVYGQQNACPKRGSGLGVLVSRMRRKFDQQGVDLPLRSVHNWGYMFAAPVYDRGGSAKQGVPGF